MTKLLLEASALAQAKRTGVGYFTTYLAEGLSKYSGQNIDVDYLWLNFLGGKQPAEGSLLHKAAISGHLRQVRWMPQRVYAKLIFAGLRLPLLFRPKYDAVLFPNFYTWNVPAAKKSVVVIHDLCFARFPEYVEEKNLHFLRRVVSSSVKRADLIITVSEFSRQEVLHFYPNTDPAKVLTLDIPVDATRFSLPAGDTKVRLKERYGITKDYILFLSTLEPRKNIPALIEAYEQLPNDFRSRYSLVLAGGFGWKTDSLKELIAQKRQAGLDIITTGYFDHQDSAAIFKNATVFALPSFHEGFGMPPLEAMFMGVPVVANDIPALREVGDGCSLLVDVASPGALGAAIQKVLADPKLRADLSAKGQAKAATYSWQKTIQKLARKLQTL